MGPHRSVVALQPTCLAHPASRVPQRRGRGNWWQLVIGALVGAMTLLALGLGARAAAVRDLPTVEPAGRRRTDPHSRWRSTRRNSRSSCGDAPRSQPRAIGSRDRPHGAGGGERPHAQRPAPARARLCRLGLWLGRRLYCRVSGHRPRGPLPGDRPTRRRGIASFTAAMRAVGASELARLVVAPVQPHERMNGLLARIDTILADEWHRVLDRDQRSWRDMLRAHAGSVRRVLSGAANDITSCGRRRHSRPGPSWIRQPWLRPQGARRPNSMSGGLPDPLPRGSAPWRPGLRLAVQRSPVAASWASALSARGAGSCLVRGHQRHRLVGGLWPEPARRCAASIS